MMVEHRAMSPGVPEDIGVTLDHVCRDRTSYAHNASTRLSELTSREHVDAPIVMDEAS
jgi:thiamine phosphate synthase YjbQ (UPF0047 family)